MQVRKIYFKQRIFPGHYEENLKETLYLGMYYRLWAR